MAEYERCSSCDEEVTSDSDFCPHCGTLFETDVSAQCDIHGDRPAVAICILCRKLLCRSCVAVKNGKRFCEDHQRIEVEQDWALIFRSPDINEAELVRSFLESIHQEVVTRNFSPHGFIWDGGGDSLFSRQAVNRPAKLFVPIPDYLKAKKELEEWESAGQIEDRNRNSDEDEQ